MQFRQRRELKRTRIEIIPMVDTMFFLLVFFMLSSLALTHMNGIQVNLPQAATAAKQPPVNLTISIDAQQHVFLNKDQVPVENLGAEMQKMTGTAPATLDQDSVVINADKIVPHGLVVQCMDIARQVGITHFAIATDPGNGES